LRSKGEPPNLNHPQFETPELEPEATNNVLYGLLK
jgi:hypothetical protein